MEMEKRDERISITLRDQVILYSGGMDSYCLGVEYPFAVKLYVDLNTPYSAEEIRRLPSDVIVFPLRGLSNLERCNFIIPLRNLYFCGIASNYGNEILVGATAGDRVLDKSEEFAKRASDMLTYLWQQDHWNAASRKIVVSLPYKQLTKTQIVRRYLDIGGSSDELELNSFSCYSPVNNRECGACKPCFRKWVALVNNNIRPRYMDAYRYIKEQIVPLIESGQYGRREEEKQILEALKKYDNL